MALINCPECGKEVSSYAEACPNCGCPKDVILESVEKTETKEYTEEETEALRKYIGEQLDDLDKKFAGLQMELDKQNKVMKIIEDSRKRNSWTFMNSGSLWG